VIGKRLVEVPDQLWQDFVRFGGHHVLVVVGLEEIRDLASVAGLARLVLEPYRDRPDGLVGEQSGSPVRILVTDGWIATMRESKRVERLKWPLSRPGANIDA
jgi:hypothetical protein